MRKTLLLTVVLIAAFGLVVAWAVQEPSVSNKADSKVRTAVISNPSTPQPTAMKVGNALPVEEKTQQEATKQGAAQPELSAAEQAKLAAEAQRVSISIIDGNPEAANIARSANTAKQAQADQEKTARIAASIADKERNDAWVEKMAQIKTDGVISADERAEYKTLIAQTKGHGQPPVVFYNDVSETEENDDCGSANAINYDDRVYCAYLEDGADDLDYFSFILDDTYDQWFVTIETQRPLLEECEPELLDSYLSLYNSDCTVQLAFSDDINYPANAYSHIELILDPSGTTTYVIQSSNPYSMTGYYHMTLDAVEFVLTPGDDCADAAAVGEGTYSVSTLLATSDGEGIHAIGHNVWYCYTPSEDGTALINLCNSSFDTKVAAYDGCTCSPLGTEMGYNDDSAVCDGRAVQSYITFPVTGGNTYLIEAGGYSSAVGDLEVTISVVPGAEPPPNDDCANAEAIEGPYPVSGSGTCNGATVDCPGLLEWNGVWYTIDLPYAVNDVTIEVCGSTEELYNAGIVWMDDCACDNYTLFSYVFTPGACATGYGLTLTASLVPGGARAVMYWPALAENDLFLGIDFDYTIDVQEHITQPGDDCGTPLTISLPPGTWPYQDLGQTTCGRVDDYFATTCLGPYYDGGEDIIYEVTVASPMVVDILLNPYATTYTGIAIGTDCPPATCLGFSTNYSATPHGITGLALLAGTYYIMVDTWPAPDCIASFDLTISQDLEPLGACCSGDPEAPTCTQYITQLDCFVNMGGYSWVEAGTCPDACPPVTPGDNCANPILVDINWAGDLPYVDNNTTCGMGNDYSTTCLGSYDDGEDIIYQVDLAVDLTLDFLLTSDASYVGIALSDVCPPTTCIAFATSSGANAAVTNQSLTAGTYYVMIDTWPAPDCIPNFTLTIEETPPPPPNDNCEDAEVIGNVTNQPWSTFSATFDGPGTCMTSNNIWYSYTATCDGRLTVSLCGSGFDTKLGIWAGSDCPPTLLAICNDDFCGLQSQAMIRVNTGEEYLFEVGGYSTASGNGVLTVGCEELCQVECPEGAIFEAELCGEDINGGCNLPPDYPFEPINCGDVICGTAWADAGFRDTDWFTFTIDAPGGYITWSVTAEFPSLIFLIQPGDCAIGNYVILASATADDCETATVSLDLAAGTWWARVGPSDWFDMPCGELGIYGNDYYGVLTCEIGVPEFSVTPTSIDENTDGGCVVTQVLTVDNVGDPGSRLNFTVNATITPLLGMFPGAPIAHGEVNANPGMLSNSSENIQLTAQSPNVNALPGEPSGIILDVPPNDLCENAEAIVGPYPVSGSGTCIEATIDCPGFLDWAAVWYTIDLPYASNNISLHFCGSTVELNTVGVIIMPDCDCVSYTLSTYTWDPLGCASGYASDQEWLAVPGPAVVYWPAYMLDIDGFAIDFDYTIDVQENVPCFIDCSEYPITLYEGEPDCGPGYVDTYNGGCNSSPYVFQDVACDAVICGTYGTYPAGLRDTDWYRIVLTEPTYLTWSLIGEGASLIFLIDAGSENCSDYTILYSATSNPCEIATITAAVDAGAYWLWAGTSVFDPSPYPCPMNYVATVSCEPVWLTVDVTSGSIGEGEGPIDVTATLDATDLVVGNIYYGNIRFVTNEGGFVTLVHDVPVIFGHTTPCQVPVPEFTVDPTEIEGTANVGESTTRMLTVSNTGDPDSWLSFDAEVTVDATAFMRHSGNVIKAAPMSPAPNFAIMGQMRPEVHMAQADIAKAPYGGITHPSDPNVILQGSGDSGTLDVFVPGGNTYYTVIDGRDGASGSHVIDVLPGEAPQDNCPQFTVFGQSVMPGTGSYGASLSEVSTGYQVFDNFTNSGIIEGIHFWGQNLVYTSSWSNCTESPMPFIITFYDDDGAGYPGAVLATYNVSLVGTPWDSYGGFGVYAFGSELDPALDLTGIDGWVSVQGTGDPSCWFLWANAETGLGDGCWQWDGITYNHPGGPYGEIWDQSFCLLSTWISPWLSLDTYHGIIGQAQPPIEITVTLDATYLTAGDYAGNIRFTTNEPDLAATIHDVPVIFHVVEAENLVGYWKFDEGAGDIAGDSSGYENDGILVNNPAWVSGLSGQALEFDGIDDYVTIPDSPSLDINGAGITFMAWIYSPEFHNFGWIMGKGQTGPWDDMVWWLLPRSNGAVRYAIKSGGSTIERIDIPVGLAIDTWQHVAVVYDGSHMRFYLNGAEADSFPKTGNLDVNDAPMLIGLDGWNPWNHYRGKIDEVKIYNRALSDEDIYAEYTALLGNAYAYLTGDANMYNEIVDLEKLITGPWRVGGDVTFLVNFFDVSSGNQPCLMNNPNAPDEGQISGGYFFASGDATGDCQVLGGDVSRLVQYFGGNPEAIIRWCGWDKPDPGNYYPPLWLNNRGSGGEQPVPPLEELPEGWPNCAIPPVVGRVMPTGSSIK